MVCFEKTDQQRILTLHVRQALDRIEKGLLSLSKYVLLQLSLNTVFALYLL